MTAAEVAWATAALAAGVAVLAVAVVARHPSLQWDRITWLPVSVLVYLVAGSIAWGMALGSLSEGVWTTLFSLAILIPIAWGASREV